MTDNKLKVKEITKRGRRRGDRQVKARVYVSVSGEGVMANLINRHDRPIRLYRKEVMPLVLEALELPPDTKFRWSQKAGCSCGCSPGFILESGRYDWTDIWAEVEAEEGVDPEVAAVSEDADQVRRVSRALQVDADPTMPMGLTDDGRQAALSFMEEVENATS